jgi:integrase/recombinase XerD
MTERELAKTRRDKKGIPPGAELRFSYVPNIEDWLCSLPLPLLHLQVQRLLSTPSSSGGQDPAGSVRLEDYLRALAGSDLPGMEELKVHLQEKYRRNCSASTLAGTVACGKLFLSFFRDRGKSCLSELHRDDVEAWAEHERERGLRPHSLRSRLAVLHAFVVFLVREGKVSEQMLSRWIRIRTPENLPKAIPAEDVKQLLGVLTGVRARALILVLLRTGMRVGELLSTQIRDVHLAERRIDIPQAQKTAKGRVVYLSQDAQDALRAWLRARDPTNPFLFCGHKGNKMCYATARVIFQKHLRKAGLGGKGYGLHCLRHTFATEMLNAGMRLECLQELLGHSSVLMTRRYARLTDATREQEFFKAIEILEKGEVHGHFQLDPELQAILEQKKLLRPHGQALPE